MNFFTGTDVWTGHAHIGPYEESGKSGRYWTNEYLRNEPDYMSEKIRPNYFVLSPGYKTKNHQKLDVKGSPISLV